MIGGGVQHCGAVLHQNAMQIQRRSPRAEFQCVTAELELKVRSQSHKLMTNLGGTLMILVITAELVLVKLMNSEAGTRFSPRRSHAIAWVIVTGLAEPVYRVVATYIHRQSNPSRAHHLIP